MLSPSKLENGAFQAGCLEEELEGFREFGAQTIVSATEPLWRGAPVRVPTYTNEFWTSGQRAAHSLHEISYRACFKPQLPRFFIERLTDPGDRVYDPFMGRGTTLLEGALLGRRVSGCDVNPLSAMLIAPRLQIASLEEIAARLDDIPLHSDTELPDELLVFYHPQTLRVLCSLREHLLNRERSGEIDSVDRWIRMVAVNRLSGHSPGFFSVYTLPPNQAISVERQKIINAARGQTPTVRDVPKLILTKSRSLLKAVDAGTRMALAHADPVLLTQSSADTPQVPSDSITLAVTSPPFLDVVDYAGDNWLRCWFCGIDPSLVPITMLRKVEQWQSAMTAVFRELHRVLKPGGHVAFEVGEVKGGKVRLEEAVIPAAMEAGFTPRLVLINAQEFTKTANCWGVDNGAKGTNTNRVVVLRKG